MTRLYISNKQKEIIKIIGLGILASSAILMPGLAHIIKCFRPKNTKEKYAIKQSYENLVNKNIIFLSGDKVQLSKKGIELYRKYQTEGIKINKPKNWDGLWHLVSYDIPEKFKARRDYFRHIIQDLGFIKIQDSLWLIPWECKEEMAIICQNIGIQPFVVYMNTNKIPEEDKIKKVFDI